MAAKVQYIDSPPRENRGGNILLIDDLRHFRANILAGLPDDTYIRICRTPESALSVLQSDDRVWDQVWLDHDLGMIDGETVDVMEAVRYLELRHQEGNPIPVGQYLIHTDNGVGAQNIARALVSMGHDCVIVRAKDFLFVPVKPKSP